MKSTAKMDRYSLTSIFLLLSISLSVIFTSCSNEKLSKDNAKKQIEAEMRPFEYGTYEIKTPSQAPNDDFGAMIMKDFTLLKSQGYINFEAKNEGYYTVYFVTFLEKAKQYILRSEASKENHYVPWINYYINVGDAEAEIVSINEPAPNSSGDIMCNVTYNRKINLNDFGKTVAFKEERYNGRRHTQNQKAAFVKTQDGWILKMLDDNPIDHTKLERKN